MARDLWDGKKLPNQVFNLRDVHWSCLEVGDRVQLDDRIGTIAAILPGKENPSFDIAWDE